jgi:hypothetical protein
MNAASTTAANCLKKFILLTQISVLARASPFEGDIIEEVPFHAPETLSGPWPDEKFDAQPPAGVEKKD